MSIRFGGNALEKLGLKMEMRTRDFRRKRNFIGSLNREDGSLCRNRTEIGKLLEDKFGEFFKASET